MIRNHIAAFCGALAFAAPALADSDGYFCAAEGLLAYDEFDSHGLKHALHIVTWPAANDELVRAKPIELDYQVHHMKCTSAGVSIYGATSGVGWWSHYDLSKDGVVRLVSAEEPTKFPVHGSGQGEIHKNLGFYSAPVFSGGQETTSTVSLPTANRQRRATLTTQIVTDETGPACQPLRIVSTLKRYGTNGRMLTSMVLFDRSQPGECAGIY